MNEYKLVIAKRGPKSFDLSTKGPDKTWERTSFDGLSIEEVNKIVLAKLSVILEDSDGTK